MLRPVAVATFLGLIPLAVVGDQTKAEIKSIYELTVKDIDGKDVSLAKYKGDVLLIVNVASL